MHVLRAQAWDPPCRRPRMSGRFEARSPPIALDQHQHSYRDAQILLALADRARREAGLGGGWDLGFRGCCVRHAGRDEQRKTSQAVRWGRCCPRCPTCRCQLPPPPPLSAVTWLALSLLTAPLTHCSPYMEPAASSPGHSMTDDTGRDHAFGALLGAAVGDAGAHRTACGWLAR